MISTVSSAYRPASGRGGASDMVWGRNRGSAEGRVARAFELSAHRRRHRVGGGKSIRGTPGHRDHVVASGSRHRQVQREIAASGTRIHQEDGVQWVGQRRATVPESSTTARS